MRLILALLLLFPAVARADDPADWRARDPDGWLAEVRAMVLGYGGAEGLSAAGIARFVAVERAGARARTLGWLVEADLDFDGQVTPAEIADFSQTLSARGRAAFGAMIARADGDRDGVITPAEGQALATRSANRRITPAKEAALRALMGLDSNNDGFVTLSEVEVAPAG